MQQSIARCASDRHGFAPVAPQATLEAFSDRKWLLWDLAEELRILVRRDPLRRETARDSFAEAMTIWFDNVIFGRFDMEQDVPYYLERVQTAAKPSSETIAILGQAWRSMDDFADAIPLWGAEEYLPKQPIEKSAANAAVQVADQWLRDTPDALAIEGDALQMNLYFGVRTWMSVAERTDVAYVGPRLERAVIESAIRSQSSSDREFVTFTELLSTWLPSLEHVSWDRVIELREHPNRSAFRARIAALAAAVSMNEAQRLTELVEEAVQSDLRALAREVRPAPGRTAIKGIAGNVPLPLPLNPLSAATAALDFKSAWTRNQRYGWLYFLLDSAH